MFLSKYIEIILNMLKYPKPKILKVGSNIKNWK